MRDDGEKEPGRTGISLAPSGPTVLIECRFCPLCCLMNAYIGDLKRDSSGHALTACLGQCVAQRRQLVTASPCTSPVYLNRKFSAFHHGNVEILQKTNI